MNAVLQPQNYFTIVRQIPNWMDNGTNYVQAVIRNALTDVIIATVQLTDKGSQRFKFDWQVPADPSGQGFYISIVTSVYTDPGYTTKNANYGDDESTYLVQERVRLNGLGGSGIDVFDVRRVITEELINFKVLLDGEKKPDTSSDHILSAIANIRVLLTQNEGKNDPILEKLNDLEKDMKKGSPKTATDISPLLERMSQNKEGDDTNHGELKAAIAEIEKSIKGLADTFDKKSSSPTTTITFNGVGATQEKEPQKEKVEEPEKKPHDISKLST